jgi:hypothetical protein
MLYTTASVNVAMRVIALLYKARQRCSESTMQPMPRILLSRVTCHIGEPGRRVR